MSDQTDYCAGCGEPLIASPNGGRYRCCSDAYWSHHEPSDRDARDHSATPLRKQTAAIAPDGTIHRHEAVWLYGWRV